MGWVECVVPLDRVLFLRDRHERPVSVRHNAGIARDSAPTVSTGCRLLGHGGIAAHCESSCIRRSIHSSRPKRETRLVAKRMKIVSTGSLQKGTQLNELAQSYSVRPRTSSREDHVADFLQGSVRDTKQSRVRAARLFAGTCVLQFGRCGL
jgi:hypothetical protein